MSVLKEHVLIDQKSKQKTNHLMIFSCKQSILCYSSLYVKTPVGAVYICQP